MARMRLDRAEAEDIDTWLAEDCDDPRVGKLLAGIDVRGEFDD